jgi:hypothetical protein
LFRSLFRGREDIYPRRFESRKTGRAGYAPACGNEWVRGVCEKPRIKCADCPNRRFLQITDEVIGWHLSALGRDFVMGVYSMLLDETCFFLAVDFDRESWRQDAAVFLETCRQLDAPAALERSRSGNGAHVWFFFEEAIPASLARKLGSHLLTETMENRRKLTELMTGYFPIRTRCQRRVRKPDRAAAQNTRQFGNSVFVDDQFRPHADQWAFLAAIRRISRGESKPWCALANQRTDHRGAFRGGGRGR